MNNFLIRVIFSIISVLLIATNLHAQTLSEAVTAQLISDSLPCQRLLGSDSSGVLIGTLASVICSRAVPLAGTIVTSEISEGGATHPAALSINLKNEKQQHAETQISAKWSLFLTTEVESLDRDITLIEDGFESDLLRVVAGSTYAINAKSDVGFAITNQRHEGDFSTGGNFKTRSTGISILGAYHPSAEFFVQAMVGYDSSSSERLRSATFDERFNGSPVFAQPGTPNADFDYNQIELNLMAGYNYTNGSITLTPQIGLSQLNSDYGTYSEIGNSGLELTVHDDERTSLQSTLGLQGSIAISTSSAVIIPQFQLSWKHEFEDKSRKVNISFVDDTRANQFDYDTEAGDRDFFELSTGVVFIFSKGIQFFAKAQTLLKHDFYHSNIASIGLNIEL